MDKDAEDIVKRIYEKNQGLRFVFLYMTDVNQDTSWCAKGHPLIEHKVRFGNVLRNIADKLDHMYEKKWGKQNDRS